MDFNKFKANASMLGVVTSEPNGALSEAMFRKYEYYKGKDELSTRQRMEMIDLQFRFDNYDPGKLSKGCLTYLIFVYQWMKYGKQVYHVKKSKRQFAAAVRGSKMEKTSAGIIERVTGQKLYRDKKQISNKHLKGVLDILDAPTVKASSKVMEIKTSYSQFDFMKCVQLYGANKYESAQMQGYLALTGKDHGEIYHVLPDFTEDVIQEHREKMRDLICPDGIETDYFLEEWAYAENCMRFSHIPDEERIIMYQVNRDEKIIEKIYEKVEFCREWLSEFDKKHRNKIAAQSELWLQKSSLILPQELGLE